MTYVMSDIHGCYDQYREMLREIEFIDRDTLYLLGDMVDRGPEPMEVLRDMSVRANVYPILGNHDFAAYSILSNLLMELNEENLKKHFGGEIENFVRDVQLWLSDGGAATIEGFRRLPMEEREYIIEYLSRIPLYETVEAGGRTFILTHAGLPEGATPDNLDNYDAFDFITANTDYGRQYFDDVFLVTGHMPTMNIDKAYWGRVYRKHNHIAIDAGAVFGGKLACVCLETDEEFYV
jgi:serine/threonine protein phosphatase 1